LCIDQPEQLKGSNAAQSYTQLDSSDDSLLAFAGSDLNLAELTLKV
jgi:hypothetical protein